ncbi:hypothetical protein [Polaromonas sp. LjRoot131]|uniref:hypothetical protein n=1 Tax=Polaromonas sp. LjRoot131 TaxID=3342262 RepID=UPI003ECC9BB8
MPVLSWAGGAEFALRWSSGGPVSADDAVTLMGLEGSRKVTAYEVEYFTVLAPPVPTSPPAIGRRRTRSDGKVELTLKYRSPQAFGSGFDTQAACALGKDTNVKVETDISVLQTLQPSRAYSVSCEREAKKKVLDFPEAMRATSMGCKNRMKRVTVGVFKVEEWQLPQGRLLEVSMPGNDTPQDLALFMAKVKPLLDKGVVLVDRSKSQAGSSCS